MLASALCLNKSDKGKNSLFGVWDRAHRCGHTRYRRRATNSRGPLDYIVALHYRGTTNQTGAPWICRKGFLRRTGLLQLLTKNRHVKNTNRESPPGGTHSQINSSGLLTASSSLRPQGSPAHAAGDERSCHVVLIFRRLRS